MTGIEEIDTVIKKIEDVVNQNIESAVSELVKTVFTSMGAEPTNRAWTENSPHTVKKSGIMGKSHRNVDTGDLMNLLASGAILQSNWFEDLPQKYKDANELGKFDDIGETQEDEQFIEKILEEKIKSAL